MLVDFVSAGWADATPVVVLPLAKGVHRRYSLFMLCGLDHLNL